MKLTIPNDLKFRQNVSPLSISENTNDYGKSQLISTITKFRGDVAKENILIIRRWTIDVV